MSSLHSNQSQRSGNDFCEEDRVSRALRRIQRVPDQAPPEDVVDHSPVATAAQHRRDHPIDRAAYQIGASFSGEKELAVDLDETILMNSYMAGAEWDETDPSPQAPVSPSIRFDRLRQSWIRILRFCGRKNRVLRYDPDRYPYVWHRRVILQARPGIIAALQGLKQGGVGLILVTASTRRRVLYALNRLPLLRQVFTRDGALRMICSEDMAEFYIDRWARIDDLGLDFPDREALLRAHAARPYSLAVKTPLLVGEILNSKGYDLLLDDSPVTAEAFRSQGLDSVLLKCHPGHVHSAYALDMVSAVVERLQNPDTGRVQSVPLRLAREYDSLLSTYPFARFEDPYYYPLANTTDQLELGSRRSA